MITFFFRIIKNGWQEFWRNRLVSGIAVIIMTVALTVLTSTYFFYFLSGKVLEILKDKVDIAVYFKQDTSQKDILEIKNALENLKEVKKVEYISKERALEEFKERHKNDEIIIASLEELEENPLEASLNIKSYHPEDYSLITQYLKSNEYSALIDKITYSQNQLAINRLTKIINSFETGIIFICIFALIIVFTVIFNTVRLAIFSKKDEIEIMRLVGASNAFIRGPFLVAGILYGLLGSIFAIIVIFLGIKTFSPYLNSFIPEINLYQYFIKNFFTIILWQSLLGVFLGIFSSIFAIRKYLSV